MTVALQIEPREQGELFAVDRPGPEEVIARVQAYKPVTTFALFSGGDGSLAATHWAMNNVDGCKVAHINTGIGIPGTEEFVRDTCRREGWPLTVLFAKDNGYFSDYDHIVVKYGFPGPASHPFMYRRLKERTLERLVRDTKRARSRETVAFLTGICHDDSVNRAKYGGRIVRQRKAVIWANPLYWAGATALHHYRVANRIPTNPVAGILGMSGECLCGCFAYPGELAAIRVACPKTAARIEALERRVRAAGFDWGWEDKGPPGDRAEGPELFQPMCTGCLKERARS